VEGDPIDSAPPVEAVKVQPKPSPVPELKAPTKHVKGRVDPIPPQHVEPERWTMLIDAPTDELWVDMMVDINNLKIGLATSADDLKQMFQVNKPLYDKLKALNPSVYADVIDNFTKAKRSFF
jgi:hypothetical protein